MTIKNADGSTYWTDYFNEQKSAMAWIDEEKTRPYWKDDFTVFFEPLKTSDLTDEQIEAEKNKDLAKAQSRKDRMIALKAIAWPTVDTVAELKAIVKTLVDETLKDE